MYRERAALVAAAASASAGDDAPSNSSSSADGPAAPMTTKELVARDCFPGLLAEDELRALTATPRPRVRGRSSSSPTVARLRASPALARAASRVALIVVLRDPIERFVSGMYYYARGVREKKLRGTPPAELTFADLPGVALMRQLLPSGWGYTGSPTCRAWRSCDSSSLW